MLSLRRVNLASSGPRSARVRAGRGPGFITCELTSLHRLFLNLAQRRFELRLSQINTAPQFAKRLDLLTGALGCRNLARVFQGYDQALKLSRGRCGPVSPPGFTGLQGHSGIETILSATNREALQTRPP